MSSVGHLSCNQVLGCGSTETYRRPAAEKGFDLWLSVNSSSFAAWGLRLSTPIQEMKHFKYQSIYNSRTNPLTSKMMVCIGSESTFSLF